MQTLANKTAYPLVGSVREESKDGQGGGSSRRVGADGEEKGSSKTCATTHTETHAYYRHTQDKGER